MTAVSFNPIVRVDSVEASTMACLKAQSSRSFLCPNG